MMLCERQIFYEGCCSGICRSGWLHFPGCAGAGVEQIGSMHMPGTDARHVESNESKSQKQPGHAFHTCVAFKF